MARSDSPRDVRSFGPRGDGSVSLPGGKRFANTRALIRFLRNNPAYAYKHRGWLMASVPTAFSEAGYVAKPGSGEMQQFDSPVRENQQGGRLIRSWFPEGSQKAKTARQQPESFTQFGTSVTVVGKGGKQTRVATAGGAGGRGTRPSKPSKPAKPARPAAAMPTQTGPDVPALPTLDVSGLAALDPSTGIIIPTALADDGAKPFDAAKVANTLAGLEFDPVIAELVAGQQVTGRQNSQNERDIRNFYKQVLGSQAKAAKRDADISEAGVDSIEDATANIVSSLGGGANQGAGMVGAAGASAVGTLGALKTAQDQFNADIRPLLEAERAGSLSRERAAGTARLHDLATRLATARGQKGQAEAARRFEVTQANNEILDRILDRKLGIVGANNQTRQTRFSNAFGLEQAKIAAAISGVELTNSTLAALSRAAGEGEREPRTVPYALSPQALKDDAYNSFANRVESLKLAGLTPQEAFKAASTFFPRGYGWSMKNPAVAQLARDAIAEVYGLG